MSLFPCGTGPGCGPVAEVVLAELAGADEELGRIVTQPRLQQGLGSGAEKDDPPAVQMFELVRKRPEDPDGAGHFQVGAPELQQLAHSHAALELYQDHGPDLRVR